MDNGIVKRFGYLEKRYINPLLCCKLTAFYMYLIINKSDPTSDSKSAMRLRAVLGFGGTCTGHNPKLQPCIPAQSV